MKRADSEAKVLELGYGKQQHALWIDFIATPCGWSLLGVCVCVFLSIQYKCFSLGCIYFFFCTFFFCLFCFVCFFFVKKAVQFNTTVV